MKKIKYTFHNQLVEMGWNEINEKIAQKEADNGEYTIEDDGQPQEVTATTDDVLNTLLGVANNG